MNIQDLDAESLRLFIKLQSEDLNLPQQWKTQRQSTHVRQSIGNAELESLASFSADQAMCRSISHAVAVDGAAIVAHRRVEHQARSDRQHALALSTNGQTATATSKHSTSLPMKRHGEGSPPASNKRVTVPTLPKSSLVTGEGQNVTATPKKASSPYDCLACCERIYYDDLTTSGCEHHYCRACLVNLFQSSFTDESLFPPKCCHKQIPFGLNLRFFSRSLRTSFNEKSIEFTTPNRTYCHIKTCSAFIPPSSIQGDKAVCRKCNWSTCTHCKGLYHAGFCPQDSATQELLRIAKQNGWQSCQSCHRIVELSTGCNHITCVCKHQFCYVCGMKWKSCKCPHWDEQRLLTRANNIVNRDAGAGAMAPAVRAAQIDRERTNLIQNHECLHERWQSRRGAHRCEECHDRLPFFIFECRQCNIMACGRCRYNRL
ncbi:unnamed protein product [Clonostachys byssicola]|uniref:RBR-type E3 ubiquitin transferase n=1 Tax=Clonostachys byssicola TaxID=160290 RepID=A0A9N9XY68_9HYPO|nr:unnamed protein product [Clonostachys byssicola]